MKNITYLLFFCFAMGCQDKASEQQNTTTETAAAATPNMASEAFMKLFEEVNVTKMHCFSDNAATPDPAYPYVGNAITGDLLNNLSDDLKPAEGTAVFGRYHIENDGMFILRYADAKGSLVLARWDQAAGKLVKVKDLAFLSCENDVCQQQDAWFIDLDDNRKMELILRTSTTEKGKMTDGDFSVFTEDGNGDFQAADAQLASLALKENYVMNK